MDDSGQGPKRSSATDSSSEQVSYLGGVANQRCGGAPTTEDEGNATVPEWEEEDNPSTTLTAGALHEDAWIPRSPVFCM
jgi:hypothetical protein